MDEGQNKLFNFRSSEGGIQRLKVFKAALPLTKMTWEEIFDMFILDACQVGMIEQEAIEQIEKSLGRKISSISFEDRDSTGMGLRWKDAALLIPQIHEGLQTSHQLLGKLEDALQELAITVGALEESKNDNPEEEEA